MVHCINPCQHALQDRDAFRISYPNHPTAMLIRLVCSLLLLGAAISRADAIRSGGPTLKENIARPLRYQPDGTDFVIRNGREFFNRPLYGGNTAFRVDGGDLPEFSLYFPGRGGNLRLGVIVGGKAKWLHQMEEIEARYRPGAMVHEIRDPMLGNGGLRLNSRATRSCEGLLARIERIPGGRTSSFAGPSAARMASAAAAMETSAANRNPCRVFSHSTPHAARAIPSS